MNNLGITLGVRYERSSTADDLDEAIEHGRHTVAACDIDHPNYALCANNLANALLTRHRRHDSARDLHYAYDLIVAAATSPTGSTQERLTAANRWGALAFAADDYDAATIGYRTAVGLLPRLAMRGITRRDHDQLLTRWSSLSRAAAQRAIAAGQPDTAIVLSV